jgi:hypothetical protein
VVQRAILVIRVGNVVNLNRYRKRKREIEERARADAAAAAHGQTGDEHDRVTRERERQGALLDGARMEPSTESPPEEEDDDGSDAR